MSQPPLQQLGFSPFLSRAVEVFPKLLPPHVHTPPSDNTISDMSKAHHARDEYFTCTWQTEDTKITRNHAVGRRVGITNALFILITCSSSA
jgi:hypothetical protein